MRKSIWLLMPCMVLANCGGGDGSGNSAPPTHLPGTAPTPSGNPLSTGEVKPTADASFLTATMDLTTTSEFSENNGIITGGATTNRTTVIDTPQFSASYNASSGYSLATATAAAHFGSAQLTRDTTTQNGNGVVLFTSISGSIEDYLALYQQTTYSSNPSGAGYTAARYGGTAGWQHTVVDGTSRRSTLNYFAYGPPTPVAAMPHSGIVNFSILSSGNYATDTDLLFLSGGNGNTI